MKHFASVMLGEKNQMNPHRVRPAEITPVFDEMRRQKRHSCMETQITPQQQECCCQTHSACMRHHYCKLAFGLVHTMLMATLTTAVTLLCVHKCSKHH